MTAIELRCDRHPRRLFARLLQERTPRITEGNLLEFVCRDCQTEGIGTKVLHRFDLTGELVETLADGTQIHSTTAIRT